MKSRSSIGEKVFQPQEIPNLIEEYTIVDLEFKKLEKVEKRKEQRHREKLKNDRILTAKENKFLHSLDLIIHTGKTAKKSNFVTYADEGKTFTIPYFRFNFGDDLLERNSLNTFLDRLLKFGCFQTFERNPHSSTLQYVFSGVDLVQLGKARKIVEAETIDPLLLSKRLKRLLANTLIKDCLLKDTRAKLIKKPQQVFWGGYSGYFADPDGYLWEEGEVREDDDSCDIVHTFQESVLGYGYAARIDIRLTGFDTGFVTLTL